MGEYKRELDKQLFKEGVNVNKEKGERYINVVAYSYDNGTPKIRIQISNKNTNPDALDNKKWINQKGISSITKEEAQGLIKLLEKAVYKLG